MNGRNVGGLRPSCFPDSIYLQLAVNHHGAMAPAMADIAFYLEQATACARAAEETNLPRLQEMYRSAQTRWQELATSETVKMNFVREAVCARSVSSEAPMAAVSH